MNRPRIVSWEPPRILPPLWQMEERRVDGAQYRNAMAHLVVIISAGEEQDGRRWVHLSVSHRSRLPKWRELLDVRDVFLGNVYAYQVLPPTEKHINIHPNVIHLWHCLDEFPLPDFTQGGESL